MKFSLNNFIDVVESQTCFTDHRRQRPRNPLRIYSQFSQPLSQHIVSLRYEKHSRNLSADRQTLIPIGTRTFGTHFGDNFVYFRLTLVLIDRES